MFTNDIHLAQELHVIRAHIIHYESLERVQGNGPVCTGNPEPSEEHQQTRSSTLTGTR
jgi:hypothetical protein